MTATPTTTGIGHPSSAARARTARWAVRALGAVIVLCVLAGIATALVGGPLIRLGDGPGGLYGVPALLNTLIAVVASLWAAVGVAHRARRLPGGHSAAPS
jgi:hypothetical protein